MVSKINVVEGINVFLLDQIDSLASTTPILNIIKPLVTRAIKNKTKGISKVLDLITEEDGTIDVNSILTEMSQALVNSTPFTFNIPSFGDINIGNGKIEIEIPFINKNIVFTESDLLTFRDLLISK